MGFYVIRPPQAQGTINDEELGSEELETTRMQTFGEIIRNLVLSGDKLDVKILPENPLAREQSDSRP